MRESRVQLAVVERAGNMIGVVTLTDVIKRVLPGEASLSEVAGGS